MDVEKLGTLDTCCAVEMNSVGTHFLEMRRMERRFFMLGIGLLWLCGTTALANLPELPVWTRDRSCSPERTGR